MDNVNEKDTLIHGLADAFAQEDGQKKEKGKNINPRRNHPWDKSPGF